MRCISSDCLSLPTPSASSLLPLPRLSLTTFCLYLFCCQTRLDPHTLTLPLIPRTTNAEPSKSSLLWPAHRSLALHDPCLPLLACTSFATFNASQPMHRYCDGASFSGSNASTTLNHTGGRHNTALERQTYSARGNLRLAHNPRPF